MVTPILAQMDLPMSIWAFYPIFVFGNHNSLLMTLVQVSGLVALVYFAVRLMLRQRISWRWYRFLVFLLYPVVVFATNVMGLVLRQF